MIERFFKMMKTELADRFPSCGEANTALFRHIEVFYNERRRHSPIGLIRSAAFERQATQVA
jgi:transposase InsO family protein